MFTAYVNCESLFWWIYLQDYGRHHNEFGTWLRYDEVTTDVHGFAIALVRCARTAHHGTLIWRTLGSCYSQLYRSQWHKAHRLLLNHHLPGQMTAARISSRLSIIRKPDISWPRPISAFSWRCVSDSLTSSVSFCKQVLKFLEALDKLFLDRFS